MSELVVLPSGFQYYIYLLFLAFFVGIVQSLMRGEFGLVKNICFYKSYHFNPVIFKRFSNYFVLRPMWPYMLFVFGPFYGLTCNLTQSRFHIYLQFSL